MLSELGLSSRAEPVNRLSFELRTVPTLLEPAEPSCRAPAPAVLSVSRSHASELGSLRRQQLAQVKLLNGRLAQRRRAEAVAGVVSTVAVST